MLKLLPTKPLRPFARTAPTTFLLSLNLKWLLQWTIFEIESVTGTK